MFAKVGCIKHAELFDLEFIAINFKHECVICYIASLSWSESFSLQTSTEARLVTGDLIATLGSILQSGKSQLARWGHEVVLFSL